MKPKFDIEKFEKLKNDEIIFECEECGGEFNSTKKYIRRALGITKHPRKPSLKYCCRKCQSIGRRTGEYLKCEECGGELYRNRNEINDNKTGKFYCSNKCKGINWNKNKNYGFNRSKIEIWIEENIKNKYDFEILFNDRELLRYEIDIYIPSLKIAFELNGIFHYESIFGEEKLKITKSKDLFKINECNNMGIELFVIDITDVKNFNKKSCKKYLDFIIETINIRSKA